MAPILLVLLLGVGAVLCVLTNQRWSLATLRQRRVVWLLANAGLMALHVWAARPLAIKVEASAKIYYGGPADGLYALLFLVVPWLFVQVVNVPFARAVSGSWPHALGWWLATLAAWLLLPTLEDKLWGLSCPAGVLCVSG